MSGKKELPPGTSLPDAVDAERPAPEETPAELLTGVESFTRELRDGSLERPMHLSEFMFQVGMAYDLPGRREEMLAQIARRKQRTRRWLVALAVVVVAAGVGAQIALSPESTSVLPFDVLGEWRTSFARYESRAFTLSEDRIQLDFGPAASRVAFPISEVRRTTVADTSVFEVFYQQDRGLTRFEFRYVEGAIPVVFLPNPLGVPWVRVQDLPLMSPTSAARGIAGADEVRGAR